MHDCDVCVTGGGIIGLSIALELAERGARVTAVERGRMLSEASQAAAGMIAVTDPENPAQLADLARLSGDGYRAYLGRIEALSGMPVRVQTEVTYQGVEEGSSGEDLPQAMSAGRLTFRRLAEVSVDPRELAAALRAAVEASPIRVMEETSVLRVNEVSGGVAVTTAAGEIACGKVIYAMGAWNLAPVTPRKGQMLAVRVPEGEAIDYVVRTPHVYAVPRRFGPRAGQMVLGATVEDAGFSKSTDAASLCRLRAMAAEFLPMLADEARFPAVDQWAGLRPDTPDHMPLIGPVGGGGRTFVAAGHYRNGILLAPGTAHVVAQLLEGMDPGVDLTAFSPARFG